MNERLARFEEKIEEYYVSCLPLEIRRMRDDGLLAEWPLFTFSIVALHDGFARAHGSEVAGRLSDKLIDIKLHYAYLLTIHEHFYRGATLLVGNNELEKLNPATISLMRAIHYRVYMISVLAEQILDLLWLTLKGTTANFQRAKWKRILAEVQDKTGFRIVSRQDADLLLTFKSAYRTAELHKFSMVRGFTSKDKWSHLAEEERAIQRMLRALMSEYATGPRARDEIGPAPAPPVA